MIRSGPLRSLAPFAAGAVFSAGLGISGMTRPSKVIGFLDPLGHWDPSLAFVMGGAVTFALAIYPAILRRSTPVCAPRFVLPASHGVDGGLLLGALVFGVGWGLSGLCPGPAIAALVTGAAPLWVFVGAMAAGALAATRFQARRRAEPCPPWDPEITSS